MESGYGNYEGWSSDSESQEPLMPRPDNPETYEVSKTPESTPARDDGGLGSASDDDANGTSPSPVNDVVQDDATSASIHPPVVHDLRTPTSRDNQALSSSGISAIQGDAGFSDSPQQSQSSITDKPTEWYDWGIINVPVKDLPDPDGVESAADFDHHISWKDARSATLELPFIQEQVAMGKTADDFTAEDQAAGLDWKNGRRRIYDLYYSKFDPVQLDKIGDQYIINSGRHRIFAAKHLGLDTIPARVKEKMG